MEREMKDPMNGNLFKQMVSNANSPEIRNLLVNIFKCNSELLATMTEEQKEIFIRFEAYLWEYSLIVDEAIFDHAFDLAMKTALEESE